MADINLDEALKQDSLQNSRHFSASQNQSSNYSLRALEGIVNLAIAPQDDAQQYASLNAADRTPVVKIEK